MIDHISIAVRDLEVSARFYAAVLSTLGMTKLRAKPTTVGFGKKYPEFWLNQRADRRTPAANSGVHVCVRAASAEAVDAFHAAAVQMGGTSDGAPGLRPEYHENYYAAFIRDLDGNRIEAVTFLTK
jgi:catechol 2,3-dioxygenase-like lactoylglutathione lyase family enzyme